MSIWVEKIQRHLIEWGYLPKGGDDGIPGPKTYAAFLVATGQETPPLKPTPKPDTNGPKLTQDGVDLIKEFEGLELKSYKDAVGVWTIGYGHTTMAGPPSVKPNMRISRKEAEDILRTDLKKYEAHVRDYITAPLTDNQYSALVSFVYNLGPGALKRSTLRRKVNAGDYSGAANEFRKWNKARVNGKLKELRGLTRRRLAERNMFEQD